MKRINQCLNKQLASVYQKTVQLEEVAHIVKPFLPDSLRSYCSVANFRQGRLILAISEVAMATELRYFIPELRDLLRQQAGLYQLVSIEVIVLTNEEHKPCTKVQRDLTQTARKALFNASKSCQYEPLRSALEHLAEFQDNTDDR